MSGSCYVSLRLKAGKSFEGMVTKALLIRLLLIGMPFCVSFVLIAIYPHRPNDVVGWSVLILGSVPVVFGLEFIGTKALQNPTVVRMGKLLRIMYGVVVAILIGALILAAWHWMAPHLGTW